MNHAADQLQNKDTAEILVTLMMSLIGCYNSNITSTSRSGGAKIETEWLT
ncbi:hypothetical protein [Paenibacillus xylanexedens]|nr:hypothetical protein [Paenibacillus xylanexedens]